MAIVIGAGIAAVGAVAGGAEAAGATNHAANQAANAQNNTLAMQQQQLQAQIAMQEQALNQQTQLSAPYRSFGESAIPQLAGMLGLNPQPVASQAPPLTGAPGSPGQQQLPQQGMGQLGGGGMPVGGQYPSSGVLSAANLGLGNNPAALYGSNNPQIGIPQPGQQAGGATLNPTQGQGMYTPAAPTTNGVPTYAGVLGGYNNILGQMENAVGLTNAQGGAPNTAAMTAALRNSPGYQFQLDGANTNAKNQASAMGMGMSGNTLQDLSAVGQGLADSTYQQYLGNLGNTLGAYQGYVGDYQNYLGNLMNSLGVGQGAAAGQAANIGQSAATMGAAYQNAGAQSAGANNNLANIYANQGNTLAGIDANQIAGLSRIAGNTANQFGTRNTLNALNNPNGQSLYQGAPTDYGGMSSQSGYDYIDQGNYQ